MGPRFDMCEKGQLDVCHSYLVTMLEDEKEDIELDLHNMAQAIMKRRDETNVHSLKELCEEHNDSAKAMEEEMQNMRRLEGQVSHHR